jgi:hypothetical protein
MQPKEKKPPMKTGGNDQNGILRQDKKARAFVPGNCFQSGHKIFEQGWIQPKWRTCQFLPSWVSPWCYLQMLE